jgi:hypothetical protein
MPVSVGIPLPDAGGVAGPFNWAARGVKETKVNVAATTTDATRFDAMTTLLWIMGEGQMISRQFGIVNSQRSDTLTARRRMQPNKTCSSGWQQHARCDLPIPGASFRGSFNRRVLSGRLASPALLADAAIPGW